MSAMKTALPTIQTMSSIGSSKGATMVRVGTGIFGERFYGQI